jgi:hypothetical protein
LLSSSEDGLASVYGFRELDQAIDVANALPVVFQASVFSSAIGPLSAQPSASTTPRS